MDMNLSSLGSTPIGTENHPSSRKRRRIRRTIAIPALCFAVSYLWWIVSVKDTTIVVMISLSRISYRSFGIVGNNNNGRKIASLFCNGWTSTRLQRRQHLNLFENTKNGVGFRHTSKSTAASTKLFMVKAKTTSKWEIGDLVQIVPKSNDATLPTTVNSATDATTTMTGAKQDTQKGEVIAIRGSGWYSVRLLQSDDTNNDNTPETIKCRGTQLQHLAFDINDGKVIPNRDPQSGTSSTSIRNSNSETKPLTSSPPPLSRTEPSLLPIAGDNLELSGLSPSTIRDLDAELLALETTDSIGNSEHSSHPIIDRRLLRQAAHHANYEKWVVFSDLHCSPSTLDTCLEVLAIVHETALQQEGNCGVLFLGDFWHHRGTLRVDCLNAVLAALKTWTVPMIMIPGNHDQVTLGGDNHGLTPLSNAYRVGGVAGPMIFSVPTVFRNALFVPHIRDPEAMKAVVGSPSAHDVSALFVHAEVRGALMNDMIVSTQGISPAVFPHHKHIYSGHFHKPHSITTASSSSTFEYMGSPYQISLAEAHQVKQLVVLDTQQNWECHERVPLCVGRRHFKISSLEELQHVSVEQEEIEIAVAHYDDIDGKSIRVKKGDRIVVSVPKNHRHQQQQRGLEVGESEEEELQQQQHGDLWKSRVQSLREQGLVVEVREASEPSKDLPSSSSSGSIPGFEELAPESVWKAYLEDAKMRNSIHKEDFESLLRVGLGILEEIEDSSSLSAPGVIPSRRAQRDLRLTSMSVAGFGPFEDVIHYPLDNRGLVLLRGSNTDCGPDSNGTGKSSLAMATLWALTGSLDARPASDMKVADVVNDNSKVAKVTVEGFINDSPFVISRSKTASKGDLIFKINDVDLTTQSVKETQAVIEERLGVDAHILTRVAFYGQHGMNDLLEATDSKLKEELSIVVPLDLWQQATSVARAKSRQARKRADEMEGMIRLRKGDIDALSYRVTRAKESRDFKRRDLMEAEQRLNRELTRIQDLLDRTSDSNVEEIQTQLEEISSEIGMLNDRHDSTMREKESHLKPLEDEFSEVSDILASMARKSNAFEMEVRTSKMSLDSARVRMKRSQEKWSLDATQEVPSVLKPPEYCPTCKQPLHSESEASGEVSEESIQNTQKAMEQEIYGAQETLQSAEAAYQEASLKASSYSETLHVQETLLRDLQLNHQTASSKWSTAFQELQGQLSEKRRTQQALTSQISMVVKESQLVAQREAAKASFNTEKLNVAHAHEVYKSLENELETAAEFLKKIQSEQAEEEHNQSVLASIGERFGLRGVQTFMLQNTVDSLQRTAQAYLSYLSDDSQTIELSLDAGDKILRSAFVRGADGEFKQRPLSTLSGGQWRRCSLALSFAFAELVASQGRLRSSLLVLDEPLTHLDRSGRAKFGELVRTMLGTRKDTIGGPHNLSAFRISTAIVILQDLSAEEIEEAFDGIDTVVRKDGKSSLVLDDMSSSTTPE